MVPAAKARACLRHETWDGTKASFFTGLRCFCRASVVALCTYLETPHTLVQLSAFPAKCSSNCANFSLSVHGILSSFANHWCNESTSTPVYIMGISVNCLKGNPLDPQASHLLQTWLELPNLLLAIANLSVASANSLLAASHSRCAVYLSFWLTILLCSSHCFFLDRSLCLSQHTLGPLEVFSEVIKCSQPIGCWRSLYP